MTLEEHMKRRNKEIDNMTLSQARDIIASRLSHFDMRIKFDKAVKMLLDCADKALEQEPKTAIWLDWTDDRNDYLKCSRCGYGEEGEVKFGEYTPYCPMCGAKMESEG